MRAVRITQPGGPDVLQLDDVATPEPAAEQILVRVHATAVNRADLLQRRGFYPAPAGSAADIPGLEYAGEVAALGQRAQRWRVGDRVMGLVGGGGYAEYVVVHEQEAIGIPASLSFEQGAAIPEVYFTAYDALHARLHVQRGERVLIHAVASGVGSAAAQLARQLGCTVLGTARSRWKLERMAELLDVAIDTTQEDFEQVVLERTNQRGVDAIVDLVGGRYLGGNVRVLAKLGRIALIGLVAGRSGELDMGMLLGKRGTIVGTAMRSRSLQEKIQVAQEFATNVLPLFEAGVIAPVIDRVLAISSVGEAHRVVEANENVGKVVLAMNG